MLRTYIRTLKQKSVKTVRPAYCMESDANFGLVLKFSILSKGTIFVIFYMQIQYVKTEYVDASWLCQELELNLNPI